MAFALYAKKMGKDIRPSMVRQEESAVKREEKRKAQVARQATALEQLRKIESETAERNILRRKEAEAKAVKKPMTMKEKLAEKKRREDEARARGEVIVKKPSRFDTKYPYTWITEEGIEENEKLLDELSSFADRLESKDEDKKTAHDILFPKYFLSALEKNDARPLFREDTWGILVLENNQKWIRAFEANTPAHPWFWLPVSPDNDMDYQFLFSLNGEDVQYAMKYIPESQALFQDIFGSDELKSRIEELGKKQGLSGIPVATGYNNYYMQSAKDKTLYEMIKGDASEKPEYLYLETSKNGGSFVKPYKRRIDEKSINQLPVMIRAVLKK
jgi:hypothetical protein